MTLRMRRRKTFLIFLHNYDAWINEAVKCVSFGWLASSHNAAPIFFKTVFCCLTSGDAFARNEKKLGPEDIFDGFYKDVKCAVLGELSRNSRNYLFSGSLSFFHRRKIRMTKWMRSMSLKAKGADKAMKVTSAFSDINWVLWIALRTVHLRKLRGWHFLFSFLGF